MLQFAAWNIKSSASVVQHEMLKRRYVSRSCRVSKQRQTSLVCTVAGWWLRAEIVLCGTQDWFQTVAPGGVRPLRLAPSFCPFKLLFWNFVSLGELLHMWFAWMLTAVLSVQYTLDHLCPGVYSSRTCVSTTGSTCVCVCVWGKAIKGDWWTTAGRVCTDLLWWGQRSQRWTSAEERLREAESELSRAAKRKPLTLEDLWHHFLSVCRSLFLWGERRDTHTDTNFLTSGGTSWVSLEGCVQWYLQYVCVINHRDK